MSSRNKKKTEPPVPANDNKTLIIVVLSIILFLFIAGALGGGLYIFLKQKAPDRQIKTVSPGPQPTIPETNQNSNQSSPGPEEGFLPPASSEKNMGYIKKVYTKSGKKFIDIDYLQWLTGADAEKAMREDGQCPKTGECIVFDGYYIRNQNPLIRTFEVAPDAEIRMMTLDSETTGRVDENKLITFDELKTILTPQSTSQQRYEFTPFIVELSNNKIVKIVEQYIP